MTISHRWSSKPSPKLFDSNIDTFRKGLPVTILPKAFQDAITVVQYFGIRYLWVDSLCISPDSESDWQHESSILEKINFLSNVGKLMHVKHILMDYQGYCQAQVMQGSRRTLGLSPLPLMNWNVLDLRGLLRTSHGCGAILSKRIHEHRLRGQRTSSLRSLGLLKQLRHHLTQNIWQGFGIRILWYCWSGMQTLLEERRMPR